MAARRYGSPGRPAAAGATERALWQNAAVRAVDDAPRSQAEPELGESPAGTSARRVWRDSWAALSYLALSLLVMSRLWVSPNGRVLSANADDHGPGRSRRGLALRNGGHCLTQAVGQPLVLVVDDDHDLCATLWDLLRERGYRVALAHSEAEADRQLHDAAFRLVLIDMKLPDGDGNAVFRLVRQGNPTARTVLITGHRSETEQFVRQILDEGADAVCYKPFDVPGLLDTVTRLASGRTNDE